MVDGPNPRRIVLGSAPPDARVHPCLEWRGEIGGLLDLLGQEGVLQLMIEGGPNTIAQFHAEHLVNRYVLYLAPAIFGGNDAKPMFSGDGAPTIETLSRGRFVGMRHVGAICVLTSNSTDHSQPSRTMPSKNVDVAQAIDLRA